MSISKERCKSEFVEIFKSQIKRKGSEELLEFLNKSDFFTAPASTRFHLSVEGGLCQHSLNVYHCLKAYLERTRVKETYGLNYSDESIAIVSLLHDLCKTNVYKTGYRNVKNDETGAWERKQIYEYNDNLPYGHGEKSVYMITGFMQLSREESFAIRYHMGFSGDESRNNIGKAFSLFPLAFALSIADMESTYFLEKE